ncbi:hypothetical protein CLOBOL_03274 [Enterocloster bolteae ATCC BAA-613]|uniref:Uncharacterized protein n=1 Tax=Enterocloster bolteae (strain ATCC BAA-613 / DSM 15670 / CCUG 46953 / JCM 12243 / WAL 16351) TaxID=411902 RepID=A8RSC5_ENTBW|nr:hypothetical protein CLOBOL_03274 [Enterocloster bolteae ATCC BAA-613]
MYSRQGLLRQDGSRGRMPEGVREWRLSAVRRIYEFS